MDGSSIPPRALLQGLVICGRCGRRMTVRYHRRRGAEVPDYQCVGESIQGGAPRCLTVPGAGVDAAVGGLTPTPPWLSGAFRSEGSRMRFPARTRRRTPCFLPEISTSRSPSSTLLE